MGKVGSEEEAGDVAMGIGDVGGCVGEEGIVIEDKLEGKAEGYGAGGGGAKLAKGLEASAMLAVEGAGETAGAVTAGDGMAAEGTDGSNLGEGGGEAGGREGVIGRGLEGFALATKSLGGVAAAVSRREVAKAVEAKPEAEDGEGVRAREEESGGEAGAARGTGGVGAEGEGGGDGDGGGLDGGEPTGREGRWEGRLAAAAEGRAEGTR